MIGKWIANALKEAMEQTRLRGPEIELTCAAREAHKAHIAIVEEIWPQYKKAELELEKLKHRMDEEIKRWSIAMAEAQPELRVDDDFEINDAHTHLCIVYSSVEERDAAVGLKSPEWANEIVKGKPN